MYYHFWHPGFLNLFAMPITLAEYISLSQLSVTFVWILALVAIDFYLFYISVRSAYVRMAYCFTISIFNIWMFQYWKSVNVISQASILFILFIVGYTTDEFLRFIWQSGSCPVRKIALPRLDIKKEDIEYGNCTKYSRNW